MNSTTEALRKLHRIHQQLTDLRERLARGPKQVSASNANLERLEDVKGETQQTLTQARMASDQKQLQLKAAEDRITDLKRKRNECSTNKEYQALIEQIAADEMATSVLSDEILEFMEKIDEQGKALDVAESQVETAKAEQEKLKQKVERERESLEAEIVRVSDELVEAEHALSGNFRAEYDRVVKARGDKALTAVEGEVCGGCFQMITSQMLNDLHMSRPVFCKSCGRLLYLPEDSEGS